MYGTLVTSTRSEIELQFKKVGDKYAVVGSQGNNEELVCLISHASNDWTVETPQGVKFKATV